MNVCMYICGMWCVVFVCVLCASEGTWCPSMHVEARGQHCGVSSILTRWCAAQRSKSHHCVVEASSTTATSSVQPPFSSIHTASSIKLQLIGQIRYWPGNSGFPPTAQICIFCLPYPSTGGCCELEPRSSFCLASTLPIEQSPQNSFWNNFRSCDLISVLSLLNLC